MAWASCPCIVLGSWRAKEAGLLWFGNRKACLKQGELKGIRSLNEMHGQDAHATVRPAIPEGSVHSIVIASSRFSIKLATVIHAATAGAFCLLSSACCPTRVKATASAGLDS